MCHYRKPYKTKTEMADHHYVNVENLSRHQFVYGFGFMIRRFEMMQEKYTYFNPILIINKVIFLLDISYLNYKPNY